MPPPAPLSPPLLPLALQLQEPVLPPPPAVPPQAISLPCKILRWDKSAELDEDETFAQSRTGSVVKFPPGLQPPPNTPSHGSVLHVEGSCRPCAWFWKPSGCKNGQNCGHCHLCPSSEIKSRKRAKQTILRLGLATPKDAESYDPRAAMAMATAEIEVTQHSRASPGKSQGSDQETAYTTSDTEVAGSSEPSSDSEKSSSRVYFPPGLELSQTHSCRPCAWFWKPVGCKVGSSCNYCHVCPQEELKTRKKCKAEAIRLGLVTPKADQDDARFSLSLSSLV